MVYSILTKYIKEELSTYISQNDLERFRDSLKVLDEILSKTAHVPVVTSVAIGAALCSFRARLIEAIGAIKKRSAFKDRIMGEGSNIHKILAIASLLYFKEKYSIPRSVEIAIDELKNQKMLVQSQSESELEESKDKAFKLLEYLARNLHLWVEILGTKQENLSPIVEQTLIDYEVRLRGIPDLILEDLKNKKAIVIEWKTDSSKTPSDYEIAQVLAYAILEARRLGYSIEELENTILGRLDSGSVKDFSILPVIIRQTDRGEVYPHPALAPPGKIIERYRKMKELLKKILIEADHLTVLLTNQEKLTGKKPEDLKVTLKSKGIYVNILRYTPPLLRRGDPRSQARWPCADKKGKQICEYSDACRFYFGEFGEKEDFERILWGLRFEALGKREEMLAVYRGLHEFFRYSIFVKNKPLGDIIKNIEEGLGIIVRLNVSPVVDLSHKAPDRKSARGKIIILRGDEELFRGGLDIVEKINIDVERGMVIASRKIRDHEKNTQYGFLPTIIREGAPVLLSLMDSWSPLLSVSVFGRIDSVNLRDEYIDYEIGFPSRLLELQRCIFNHYMREGMHGGLFGKYLLVEINVDLTKADLEALDAMQRSLKREYNSPTESNLDKKRIKHEIETLKGNIRFISQELGENTSFEDLLKHILSRRR